LVFAGFERAHWPSKMKSALPPFFRGKSDSDQSSLGWGFNALVGAQFLGAVNDHYLKMVVSLIAIEEGTRAHYGVGYLSITGMALIVPYLLLSGYAGYFADRYNKRSVLIATKGFECVLGFVVLAALLSGRIEFLIGVLFILGAQSVFFSPAKYGILPEMMSASNLTRANGMLELGRYMAIIAGTLLGGALMHFWSGKPVMLASVVVFVALFGWLVSFGIRRVPYRGAKSSPPINPWREIWIGTKHIARERRMRFLVTALTSFDFAVTILLMNVLVFAKQTMTLDDFGVGLLAGTAGIGIGVGSAIVGRLSGHRVELAYVPLGAMGSGVAILTLGFLSESVLGAAFCIFISAGFAGFVIVPLYTALQRRAERTERGTIIATNNFLNMAGVLFASGALWALHDGLRASSNGIFFGIGGFLVVLTALGLTLAKWTRLRLLVILCHAGQGIFAVREKRRPSEYKE
jgi:acyl-[acyl-carrier-protein]-phospholipid O-acyltransferase/long-chain-fatty-acid--[acyl-carrier-protein] ligase